MKLLHLRGGCRQVRAKYMYMHEAVLTHQNVVSALGNSLSLSLFSLLAQSGHSLLTLPCPRGCTTESPSLVDGLLAYRGGWHYRNPSASRLDRDELKRAVSDPDLLGGAWRAQADAGAGPIAG